MPYEELLIALENITIDKVTRHSVSKVRKMDTSALLEIGVAAGTDGEEAFEEGCGKTFELAVQAVYKGTGAKGGRNGGKGPSWSVQKYHNNGKGEKGANRAGKGQWPKTGGKEGGKGQEEGGKGDIIVCWSCGENRTHCGKLHQGSWNKSLNAVEEVEGDISEEVHEDEGKLHAWCSGGERERAVARSHPKEIKKKKKKKLAHESLLSAEKQLLGVSKGGH